MSLISIVVPVYYNAATLPLLLERFEAAAAVIGGQQFEYVFVDDGSGDNSFDVLVELAGKNERVRVVRLSRNFGSNAAILAGLTYCNGDCAVVISADLQDPPELVPDLVQAWQEGAQVVLAARRNRQDPFLSRIFSSIFNRLFRRFVFPDFPAGGFDFMLIDRRVVDVICSISEKNSYIFGQVMWVGFARRVIYYDREERAAGSSRWTVSKKIKYFIDSFTAFSYLPLRFFSLLGTLLAVLGFLYALLIIVLRFVSGYSVAGWASLTVIVLLVSGVQLIMMGVLGEYLWRALDESRRRPPFIVNSVVNVELDGRPASGVDAKR